MNPLLHVVSALASARTLEEAMGVVRRSARALTRADGITFVLRDGGMCHYAEEDAIAPLWKGRRFPLQACISGWVIQHREPVIIPNIYADPRIAHEVYRPTFVRSLAMMPVSVEAPIAAIGAYWARRHTATGAECEVLRALADALALAMRNAGLNEQRERLLAKECEARRYAEDANKLKDDFLATLSHELRSALQVTQNWLWLLRRSRDPKELRKGVEVMERNTALQSRLVEDLLDVSRASTGKLGVKIQLVNLGDLCEAVIEGAQPSARDKSIQLELLSEHTPSIWGDPDRIQQMLWNVLNNAIKFTPRNGRIRLRIATQEARVIVAVEDNGIGIEPQFLPFMFDRFRQAEQGPSRRYGGLGLGLNIVRELAQMHGATVSARSDGIDQGATVTIEFPVPSEPNEPRTGQRRRADSIGPSARMRKAVEPWQPMATSLLPDKPAH